MDKKRISPWAWIPTLYFAQGLPYVAVMTISVIMYKRLGISNTDIALYTSWLYLPWVIKPFWSPFVDLFKTKRWWIVAMQLIVGVGFAGIAFTLPLSAFFQLTLAIFWIIGFSSATHDIAADGFYMLALDTHGQSMYVGIRSTFYRCATVFGQGILVIIAGLLEMNTGLEPVQLNVKTSPSYSNEIRMPGDMPVSVSEQQMAENNTFIYWPETVELSTQSVPAETADSVKAAVEEHNMECGFVPRPQTMTPQQKKAETGWWTAHISDPFGNWIRNTFGKKTEAPKDLTHKGALSVMAIRLAKAPEAGETVALNTVF